MMEVSTPFFEQLSATDCKFSMFLPTNAKEAPNFENKIAVEAPIPEEAPKKQRQKF